MAGLCRSPVAPKARYAAVPRSPLRDASHPGPTQRLPDRVTRLSSPTPGRCAPLRTQLHHPVQRLGCIRMGRRSRNRAHGVDRQTGGGMTTSVPRSRMARVQVDDVTWSTFRASIGATPASVALGKLVEREVAASRRRSAPDDAAVAAAVDEARGVAAELRDLIDRLDAARAAADAARGHHAPVYFPASSGRGEEGRK